MRKSILIFALSLLTVIPLQAQFAKPLRNKTAQASRNTMPFSLGLTGSYAANDMVYTAMKTSDFHFVTAPTFGLAAEYNTMQRLAVGIDFSYVMRGTKEATSTVFLSNYETTTSAHVSYAMSLKGMELRIPITLYLGYGENFMPYVYLAPRASLWLGDSIRWERTYDNDSYLPVVYTHAVDQSTIKPYDISMVGGLGLCSRLMMGHTKLFVKLDVNYGISLFSNFSEAEINAAQNGDESFVFHGWGDIEHEELGRRHLQNIEARLTVLLPLHKPLKDACAFDQNMKKARKQ